MLFTHAETESQRNSQDMMTLRISTIKPDKKSSLWLHGLVRSWQRGKNTWILVAAAFIKHLMDAKVTGLAQPILALYPFVMLL